MSQIRKIFEELQAKGLIDKDAALLPSPNVENFQKALFKKAILFNPAFADGILDDNCLRFVLLHEWGHKVDRALRRPIIISAGFIFGVIIYLYFVISYLIYPILLALSFLIDMSMLLFESIGGIVILISLTITVWVSIILFANTFKKWGYMDEYKADLWAAERICKVYGFSPSFLLSKCLKIITNTKIEKTISLIIEKHLLFGVPTHPSIEERVKFIRNKDKGWECKKIE